MKADVDQQQTNEQVTTGNCILQLLLRIWNGNVEDVYFSFNFAWYSIKLNIVGRNRGRVGVFYFKQKNLLSVTEVICQ